MFYGRLRPGPPLPRNVLEAPGLKAKDRQTAQGSGFAASLSSGLRRPGSESRREVLPFGGAGAQRSQRSERSGSAPSRWTSQVEKQKRAEALWDLS